MNTLGHGLLCLAILGSGSADARFVSRHGGAAGPPTPPVTAGFTVCNDPGGTDGRTMPNGTDNAPGTYWWYNGNLYVISTDGTGYWYTSNKPSYGTRSGLMWPLTSETLPGFTGISGPGARWTHGYGTGTVQTNTDSITGTTSSSRIWQHARHTWPTSVLSIGAMLYGFYHEEVGACPLSGPITCNTLADCGTLGPGGAYGQCYWDKFTGLADPGAGKGYCMLKTGGRASLASSSDHGATWTDLGRIVHPSLDPDYCAATTGVDWSGGVEFPVALIDADGWVYVTITNLSGDPATPSLKKNQGVLIARISQSDLAASDAENRLHFYDNVAKTWTFSTQLQNGETQALFWSNVAPLNYPANAMSWGVTGPYGTPVGNFSTGGFSYNTQLQTYILAASNFIKNTGGTNSPGIYYFKGASLATDPLNWVPFDSYIDTSGTSHTTGAAGISPVTGPQDNCDYYWQWVGPGTNAVCTTAQGIGVNGYETEKCFGPRADWFMRKNMQCASPAAQVTSTMYLKFARNSASSACP